MAKPSKRRFNLKIREINFIKKKLGINTIEDVDKSAMKLLKEKLLSRPLKEVQKEILEEFSCMTEIPDTLKSEIAVSTIKENLEILKKQFEKE